MTINNISFLSSYSKYWDQRYRINSSKIPVFLKKYEQIIYKTGKYVSIINKVKALYLKSSRVAPALAMAPSHASQSLLGVGMNQHHGMNFQHHNHQPSMNSIAHSESASKYSLNDLLRGAASMQFGGSGFGR